MLRRIFSCMLIAVMLAMEGSGAMTGEMVYAEELDPQEEVQELFSYERTSREDENGVRADESGPELLDSDFLVNRDRGSPSGEQGSYLFFEIAGKKFYG